jgi:hypothetical protein
MLNFFNPLAGEIMMGGSAIDSAPHRHYVSRPSPLGQFDQPESNATLGNHE